MLNRLNISSSLNSIVKSSIQTTFNPKTRAVYIFQQIQTKTHLTPGKLRQRKAHEVAKKRTKDAKTEIVRLQKQLKDLEEEHMKKPDFDPKKLIDEEDELQFGPIEFETDTETTTESFQAGLLMPGVEDVRDIPQALGLASRSPGLQVLERMQHLLKDGQGFPTSPTYILKYVALHGDGETAENFLKLLEQHETPVDIVDYNNVMKRYGLDGNLEKVQQLFNVLDKKGLLPNLHTYSILISTCLKKGKSRWAFRIFESMIADGIAPDIVIFNQLIVGSFKTGELDQAQKLVDMARLQFNIVPDLIMYTTMIHLAGKRNEPEKAFDLFKEMTQDKKIVPTEQTYGTLIGSMKPQHMRNIGIQVFESFYQFGKQQDLKFEPSLTTWTNLMSIVDLATARDIWNYLAQLQATGVYPELDFILCRSMMVTFLRSFSDWNHHIGKEMSGVVDQSVDFPSKVFEEWMYQSRRDFVPRIQEEIYPCESFSVPSLSWLSKPEHTLDQLPKYITPDWVPPKSTLLSFDTKYPTFKYRLNSPDLMLAEAEAFIEWAYPERPRENYGLVELYLHHPLLQLNLNSLLGALDQDTTNYGTQKIRFQILRSMVRIPAVFREHGEEFWNKHVLQWSDRVGNQKPQWWNQMYNLKIEGYANLGDVDKAFDLLEKKQELDNLEKSHQDELPHLYKFVHNLKMDGKPQYLKKFRQLCVPKQRDDLEEAYDHLRKKKVDRNWWGWTAIGSQEISHEIKPKSVKPKRGTKPN